MARNALTARRHQARRPPICKKPPPGTRPVGPYLVGCTLDYSWIMQPGIPGGAFAGVGGILDHDPVDPDHWSHLFDDGVLALTINVYYAPTTGNLAASTLVIMNGNNVGSPGIDGHTILPPPSTWTGPADSLPAPGLEATFHIWTEPAPPP